MPALSATKFLRLLQTFDEKELNAFDAWLRSPWCNSNKNLPRLLEKLKRYHPKFDKRKLDKETLFHEVLPQGKFSDRRMNNLLSEAYLAAEQFLAFHRFSHKPGLQQALLAEEFQGRYLDDWFFRNAGQEIERLEAMEVKDWESQLNLYRLYRLIYHHPNQNPRMQPGGSPIGKMGAQADLLYLLEKAAIINEMMARNRLLRGEDHDVAAELKKWEAVGEGVQHPSIDLYRMRFAFLAENQLSQYWALRDAFLNNRGQHNEREQKLHLVSLLNDTMAFIKSGQLDITDSLPLYQLGLETGVLLHQGQLSRNTYTTIVIASNTKGAFDFTTHFIETYTAQVEKNIRNDCYNWARAHTAYWQQNLEECLAILKRHTFKAPYFQLIGRVLNTQVYFDLFLKDESYQRYLFSYFDTFEKWLGREKVWSKSAKASFLRFVQICRPLARYHADAGPETQKVEHLLRRERNVQALNWLKQKKEEVLRLKAGKTPRPEPGD